MLSSHVSIINVKSFNDRKSDFHFVERGMTIRECRMICTSQKIPVREKLFFRMIYETLLQPSEVLNLQIENWDKEHALITAIMVRVGTKPLKGNTSKKVWLSSRPKTRAITLNTNKMLLEYVDNRKKGPIFINSQTGYMISLT
jgi:integrase